MNATSTLEPFPTPAGLDLPPAEALLSLMAQAEPISEPWSRFARALMTEGKLPEAWRELVILRVGWRHRASYVLGGHIKVAGHCGLSEQRIALAMGQPSTETPDPVDALLLSATDDLIDMGRVAPENLIALDELVGTAGVLELTMLAGQYVLISMVCQTFGLVPERAG